MPLKEIEDVKVETFEDQVFNRVCTALGFLGNAGFLENEADTTSIKQRLILQEAKEKLGIDAVYLIQTAPNSVPIPVIYFKKLKVIDTDAVRKLHKRIWNQGRTPLLFVIAPGQISVYNCFEPPPKTLLEDIDAGKRLISRLSEVANEEEIRQKLGEYSREKIDIGEFLASTENQFNAENRADQHLLRNLRFLRHELINEGLNYKHVHSLIGRSIFILYLEDRGALTDFFKGFQEGKYAKFTQVLRSKEDTYDLFERIAQHFNGDMFPVTEEEQSSVTIYQLSKLRAFLRGTDPNGQERLWPYSFDVIPIEFISSIYEEFFHYETAESKKKSTGAHYTPLFLVEFLLDQVLPPKNGLIPTILDPSCGSGIFLVAAYRRLITENIAERNEKLNVEELKNILCNNIYGVDINGEAIRVAAFSLYLTMLDYLEPKSLWEHQELFPKLIGNNLFEKNFFESGKCLEGLRFDIIVGNTPWESGQHVSRALKYFQFRGKAIGDKQIAQAFLWEALQYAKPNSTICLIVTSKGLLFNRSPTNALFRKQFFEQTNISTIINFSAMRHDIFENAVGPAAAIIYSPLSEAKSSEILYVVPKPSDETKKLGAIVVNDTDIKRIPREFAISDSSLWKAAMWGTPRDWQFLMKLKTQPTLQYYFQKHICDLRCSIGDGFQVNGGDKNERKWMSQIKYLPVESLHKYTIPSGLKNCKWTVFHRPRARTRYTAPLCLIKAAPIKGEVIAAYTQEDTCYDSNIIGIAGRKEDEWALKIITAYLNSSIAQYFLFLTCSKWGVERDDILVKEYLDLPLILPTKESVVAKEIIQLHDEISRIFDHETENFKKLLEKIDEKFFGLFEVTDTEKELISDTITYTLNFFQDKDKSLASKPANPNLLIDYAKRVQGVISLMLSNHESINATIYTGSKSLVIVSFSLKMGGEPNSVNVISTSLGLDQLLLRLRHVMTEKVADKIYFVRKLKIYEEKTIYFVKPNEARYWTRAVSYEDADDVIADILETWRDSDQFIQEI